jgi:hypothetical protein
MSSEEVFTGMLTETLSEIKLIRQDNHALHVEQVRQNGLLISNQDQLLKLITETSEVTRDVSALSTKMAVLDHSRGVMWAASLRWGGFIALAVAAAAYPTLKSGVS